MEDLGKLAATGFVLECFITYYQRFAIISYINYAVDHWESNNLINLPVNISYEEIPSTLPTGG